MILQIEHQRHQPRPRLHNVQPELTRDLVAKTGRANLGNRKSPGRNHQRWRTKLIRFRAHHELSPTLHLADAAVQKYPHPGRPALSLQQVRNIFRRAVAEQLSQRFLVIRDAMFLHQGNEVRGRVTRQRGFREMRVRGEEVFCLAINVGKIATSAAGDKNFLADAVGTLDNRGAAAAFAGFDRADQPGRPCADNHSVECLGHGRSSLSINGWRCIVPPE